MKYTRLTKRMTAAAMCAVLGTSASVYALPPMAAYAAGYQKVDGNYQMLDGTVIDGAIARGIDVSRWQGNIDWNAVANDDVNFVMMGTRSKGVTDPYFHANMKGASDAGIKVGAYIYSLATTPEMAIEEADFVLDLVKDYPVSFPIAFDAEDSATLGTLPTSEVSAIIQAFCQRIEEAGYHPIIYANDYWLANKIDMSKLNYDVWVARYEIKHNYSTPIMWQATSTGSINGIAGNVDIDFLYKDLTTMIPSNLWRTIGGRTYYYQNYTMQKDAWIHDGNGWYYMNTDGLASTGWLEKSGSHYYLSPEISGKSAGKMVNGWLTLDNKWYYLDTSGAMSTGWVDDNGSRFYMNSDGIMSTGWLDLSGSKYFLGDNGAASVGWKQLDQAWYYFNGGGDMARGWTNPDGSWYYLNEDGKMNTGWLKLNGITYYTSLNSGKMTTGWREVDGAWHYFNESGAMMTGLTDIGGALYYLNPADGKMAASTTLNLDGVDYQIDASGVCTKVVPETEAAPAETQPKHRLKHRLMELPRQCLRQIRRP